MNSPEIFPRHEILSELTEKMKRGKLIDTEWASRILWEDHKRKRISHGVKPRKHLVLEQEGDAIDDNSWFWNIPNEIVLNICRFLDTNSLLRIALVSKRFRHISNDNILWEPRFRAASIRQVDYRTLKKLSKLNDSWKRLYQEHRKAVMNELVSAGMIDPRPHSCDLPQNCRSLSFVVNTIKIAQENFDQYKDFQIIELPANCREWTLCKHSSLKFEWIEESHRVWRASTTERMGEKMHTEYSLTRKEIVIDVGPEKGMRITEKGREYLARTTGCTDQQLMCAMPRDHPTLVQMVHTLGEQSGSSLVVVSIPAEAQWFIMTKSDGKEMICESFRRWPAPTRFEMDEIYNNDLQCDDSNLLYVQQITVDEWDEAVTKWKSVHRDVKNNDTEDDFGLLTDVLEESWR
ncbi:hypothetical protein PROFUN_09810 [Planoprotostelium fungivorum]|uniref:F-box domain-containing protein n=1 Tax=Planoprotostelium fungivorum TaxID=1890364 RepID=A0A2P6NGR1_9EUKA|nr:hypothetical protein PROFUN_09810 [Planoprotostelium fungivorum]